MRKILFRLMILVVLFLVFVLIVAAKNHTSPKMVMQNRFNKNAVTTSGNANTINTGDTTPSVNPITTSNSTLTASGELSAEDKAQTEDFINSLIQ